jgi:hypothetical protein
MGHPCSLIGVLAATNGTSLLFNRCVVLSATNEDSVEAATRRPSRATDLLRGIPAVHIALTRSTHTCVLTVRLTLIQIYWTVLY